MRKGHKPLSLSIAYVLTIPDEQCKIADLDNAHGVWPNIREKSCQKCVTITAVPDEFTPWP